MQQNSKKALEHESRLHAVNFPSVMKRQGTIIGRGLWVVHILGTVNYNLLYEKLVPDPVEKNLSCKVRPS